MIKFGWWEQFKCWLVCRYLRNRYNMSHCQWGVRRKRVLGAVLDGIRAEFTEDNWPTTIHGVMEEMLENSVDHQEHVKEYGGGNYTIIIGEKTKTAEPEPPERLQDRITELEAENKRLAEALRHYAHMDMLGEFAREALEGRKNEGSKP